MNVTNLIFTGLIAIGGLWAAIQIFQWYTEPAVDLYVVGTANDWEQSPIVKSETKRYKEEVRSILVGDDSVKSSDFTVQYLGPNISDSDIEKYKNDLESYLRSEKNSERDIVLLKSQLVSVYESFASAVKEVKNGAVRETLYQVYEKLSDFEDPIARARRKEPNSFWDLKVVNDGEKAARNVAIRVKGSLVAETSYSEFYESKKTLKNVERKIDLGTLGPKENIKVRIWSSSSGSRRSASDVVISSENVVGKNLIESSSRDRRGGAVLSRLFYIYIVCLLCWISAVAGYRYNKSNIGEKAIESDEA